MTSIIRRGAGIIRAKNKASQHTPAFEEKRIEFVEKAKQLRQNCSKLEAEMLELHQKAGKWQSMIAETQRMIETKSTRYARGKFKYEELTHEAVHSLTTLVNQAEGYLELTEREIRVKQELVEQSRKNLDDLTSILNRLEAIEYQREVAETLRDAHRSQSSMENHLIERLDSESFAREMRAMDYTTQALLEITSTNYKKLEF